MRATMAPWDTEVVRLRPEHSVEELTAAVDDLRIQVGNFAAWSAGPNLDALRNTYLTWVRDAEQIARRFLSDVPADRFATSRWSSVLSDSVPRERLWSVIEGDASAQLDWFGSAVDELTTAPTPRESWPDRLWRTGTVRLFMSHLASEKAFVGAVREELLEVGVDGFVAHDAIEPSAAWQSEIEHALETSDAFVGLLHPGFGASNWTQQEVGWAVARRIPLLTVRLGEVPTAFVGKFQAPSGDPRSPWAVASTIAIWLSTLPDLGSPVVRGLMSAVRTAPSFKDAEAAALRVERMGRLSPALLDELGDAYLHNDQLYPRHVGARVIQRILGAHGRTLPTP